MRAFAHLGMLDHMEASGPKYIGAQSITHRLQFVLSLHHGIFAIEMSGSIGACTAQAVLPRYVGDLQSFSIEGLDHLHRFVFLMAAI